MLGQLRSIHFIPKIFFACLLRPIWELEKYFPRNKNLWIFSSWCGQQYSDSTKAFYEYIRENKKDIKCVWLLKNKSLIKELRLKGMEVYNSNSIRGLFLSLKAGKFFSVSSPEFPLYFVNGAEFYEIWHGMPLKKILKDDSRYPSKFGLLGKIRDKIFVLRDFLDCKNLYTVTNSRFFLPYLQTAFDLPEQRILKTGLPRCDKLFAPDEEPLINKIRTSYNNCKILLYMPTFRTSAWTKKIFDPFKAFEFNEQKFNEMLEKKNIVFLYKPHFADMSLLTEKEKHNRFLTITNDDFNDIYSLCSKIDILMTDYSSIYFDFIVTKKPVILAPFDIEEYKETAREHYFDYSELEGIKAYNWEEVFKILDDESYKSVSDETLQKFAEFVDGNSSEKLFSLVAGC